MISLGALPASMVSALLSGILHPDASAGYEGVFLGVFCLAAFAQVISGSFSTLGKNKKENRTRQAAAELTVLDWQDSKAQKIEKPHGGGSLKSLSLPWEFYCLLCPAQILKDNRQRNMMLQVVRVNALKRNNWYGTIKCYHYIRGFPEQRGITIAFK